MRLLQRLRKFGILLQKFAHIMYMKCLHFLNIRD